MNASGDTDYTATKSFSVNSGDLIVAQYNFESGPELTPPSSDWEVLWLDQPPGGFYQIFWKVAGSSEPTSYGFTGSYGDEEWQVEIGAWRPTVSDITMDAYTQDDDPNDPTCVAPSVLASAVDPLLIVFAFISCFPVGSTPPVSMTERWDTDPYSAGCSPDFWLSTMVCADEGVTAGETGTREITFDNDSLAPWSVVSAIFGEKTVPSTGWIV